jgi:hypothetical protein
MNKTEWIQTLPCHNCGGGEWVAEIGEWRTQAAHCRRANNSGTATKPSDKYLVPLCSACHLAQHQKGEGALDFDMLEAAECYENEYKSME